MATYQITHESRPAARIQDVDGFITFMEVEVPGISGLFVPVDRRAHPDMWDSVAASYEGAAANHAEQEKK